MPTLSGLSMTLPVGCRPLPFTIAPMRTSPGPDTTMALHRLRATVVGVFSRADAYRVKWQQRALLRMLVALQVLIAKAVLMRSTPLGVPSGHFTSFRVIPRCQILHCAGQPHFASGFDSRQLHRVDARQQSPT